MSNLIESMINENVQFSESKKVKKTTDKKVVKESKESTRNSVDFRRNRILYTLADKAVKGSPKYQDVADYIIDKYGFDINTLESFGDLRMKLNELGLIEVTELYNYLIETGLIEPKKESKKKKVEEAVGGDDEIYVIVNGGMIEDVFTTNNNLDVSVIDLDVEYDDNLYRDVIDRYERNELKNAYVYYEFESLKGKKIVKESSEVDRRDLIERSLHTVEQDAQGVYESIMKFKESVRRVLFYINRQQDLSETEYSEYIRKLTDNMYMYLETMTTLKDTSSELGRLNQALIGFARGTITLDDLMREL